MPCSRASRATCRRTPPASTNALFRPKGDEDDDGKHRREVGCWSHAPRKYWEAAFAKEPVAREALLRIGKLFELDFKLRGKRRPPAMIARLRNQHLRPLVEELLAFAARRYEPVRDRRGSLRSALGYSVRQADALRTFLDDGRLRKVVRIRDAALFAGSDEHAEAAGHILSLIASARLHDLDPERYLRDLIRVLLHWPRERFLELAPETAAPAAPGGERHSRTSARSASVNSNVGDQRRKRASTYAKSSFLNLVPAPGMLKTKKWRTCHSRPNVGGWASGCGTRANLLDAEAVEARRSCREGEIGSEPSRVRERRDHLGGGLLNVVG